MFVLKSWGLSEPTLDTFTKNWLIFFFGDQSKISNYIILKMDFMTPGTGDKTFRVESCHPVDGDDLPVT